VAALAGTAVRSMATSAAASATATDGARRKILRCMANLCGGWGGGYGVRVPGGGPAVLAERGVWGRQRRTSRGLTG